MPIKCPKCGESITDDAIERALQYAHDCGFDEGYEFRECELYEVAQGYQCGNCGRVHQTEVTQCDSCGSFVVGVIDEG